jgi:PPOX class probable F420-dependent enzyme
MPMTKNEIDELLAKPNVAVLAVTAPNGAPHAVPTWYEYQDGTIIFHTDPRAYKHKCLQHDPRVTLVVDTKLPPFYKCVIVKGRATVELKNDDARFRRMAIAYMGKEDGERYADSMAGGTAAVVSLKLDHVISWDYERGYQ